MICPILDLLSNEISCSEEAPDKLLINDKQGPLWLTKKQVVSALRIKFAEL